MRNYIWVIAVAGFLVAASASAQTTKEGKKTEVKVSDDGTRPRIWSRHRLLVVLVQAVC